MQFFRDLKLSAFTAGCVAVLVGFTSSGVIVFHAAQAFNATPEQISSWMWALLAGAMALFVQQYRQRAACADPTPVTDGFRS